jgi:hypothetical protein
MIPGCPRHPYMFSKDCHDVRCQKHWSPDGAPTPDEQLALWVQGKPVCPNDRHECCPDFSCCRPKLLWPEAVRLRFAAAGQGEREKMMMSSVDKLIAESGKNVYVTRGDPKDRE